MYQGLLTIRGDNYAEFSEAYTNFHQAIGLDAHFAQPYVGLLELRLREGVPSLPPCTPEEMRLIAGKLKELAPNLAAPAVAQSVISYYGLDFPAARRFALQAIKADSKYELGHTWYGFMLLNWGWPVEGRAQLEISQTLAPSKVTVYRCLAHTYYMERDFTNAIIWYRKALELEPHHAPAYQFIGAAQQALGDYTNALNNLDKSDLLQGNDVAATKRNYDELRHALGKGGVSGFWQQQWKGTVANTNTEFYWKALIQIHLGNTNAALDYLNRSYETRYKESCKIL